MLFPHLATALLAALHVLAAAPAVAAQATSGTADGGLSVGAAVGIAVTVSVTVCTGIAAIVICLLSRRWRPKHGSRRPRSAHPDNEHCPHGRSKTNGTDPSCGQSQQSIIQFVEEGTGADAQSAVTRTTVVQLGSKPSADSAEETHEISVRVTSPDDLRFKVCRRAGEILVATDPVHSSLCSREGVRNGDRILGVYVDIESASGAHPKEVSELLSLASDYRMVVNFQHRGPLLRGPPEKPEAMRLRYQQRQQQRPVSAAEKALRKNRDRAVDVVDGGEETQPEPPARHYSAEPRSRKSDKPRAPQPPLSPLEEDPETSEFAIRDRRRPSIQEEDDTGSSSKGKFATLCETLALAESDEAEWQPLAPRLLLTTLRTSDGPEDSLDKSEVAAEDEVEEEMLVMEQTAPRLEASVGFEESPPWESLGVERDFDHYELEEQDVVAAMPPPSAERPVVDCCTQFDGCDQSAREDSASAAAAVLGAAPLWESLKNHSWPLSVAGDKLAALLTAGDGAVTLSTGEMVTADDDQVVAVVTADDDQVVAVVTADDDQVVAVVTADDDQVVAVVTADDDQVVAVSEREDDRVVIALLADGNSAVGEETAVTEVAAEACPHSTDAGIFEQCLSSVILVNDDPARAEADAVDEEEADLELANYLAGAVQQLRRPDSPASSSVHTVQEEAVVQVKLAKDHASVAGGVYRREDSLVELTRSMALRDVEVATVILLDSEARRRLEAGSSAATTASSSGRSTVQEEAIDPAQAPERRVPTASERQFMLDELGDFDASSADVDEDDEAAAAAAAAVLNADFDLAASEWVAREPPPLTSLPTPPPPPPLHVAFDTDGPFEGWQSPLLDPGLVSEIVQGAQDIWSPDDPDEAATYAEDFDLDDSQLTGESLDQLLRRLEDREEY